MPLSFLDCSGPNVADLSPLIGMPLTTLNCNYASALSDLSPLKDLPLTSFSCGATSVSDFSPLVGVPLTDFHGDFKLFRDTGILRSMTTIERFGGPSAAEFWKRA